MRLESLTGAILDHKYRIDRQLGRGAMGAVFQATHLGTMRTVALKVIVPKLAAEAEFTQRFKREAEAAGRLRHPNVVNVTDFGVTRMEDGDLAYMVMEYLDGQTLTAHLKEDPRPAFSFILDVVDQVALALDAAHAAGIVHRDLKPANIWLEPNRRGGYNVKVLDFGIAKVSGPLAAPLPSAPGGNEMETVIMAPAAAAEEGQENPTLMLSTPSYLRTTVGTLLGTPAYMAPEQCQGAEVDYRADIYSLATIVYEMLCSRLPFQTEDYKQLVRMQVNETPEPPSKRDPTVPPDLSNVVMSGLAKDPAARPASAGAFATQLRSMAEGELAPIRRSKDLFHTYTSCFFPPLFACIAMVALLLAPFWAAAHWLFRAKAASPAALMSALGLAFFGLVIFGGQVYKAACALILLDAVKKEQFVPQTRSVMSRILRGLPTLLVTHMRNLLAWSPQSFCANLLWPVVWAREGKSGRAALERSRELCGNLSSGALRALAVRQSAPAAIGMFIFPAVMALTGGPQTLQFLLKEELVGSGFGLFCVLYPLFFMVFYVNYGPAFSFLYWTALESRGEAGAVELPSSARDDRRRAARKVRPATILWVALPLVGLALVLDKAIVHDNGAAMQAALNDGRRTAVVQALNAGLSADYRDSGEETPLFEAVRVGDAKLVAALLARGAAVNARSHSGSTPLIQAACYDRLSLAQLLLGLGASVDATNNDGRTALIDAAMRGNLTMVQLLLSHGADPKRVDSHGKSALAYAQEEGYPEIAELLRR